MNTKNKTIAVLMAAIIAISMIVPAVSGIAAVSGTTYITDNAKYDRNPAAFYDGSNFWMFYAKDEDRDYRTQGGTDVDSDFYSIYYKTASTASGLVSATETIVPGSNVKANYAGDYLPRCVEGFKYSDGNLTVLVSCGAAGGNRSLLYRYTYVSGSGWTGPTEINFSSLFGETMVAHIDAIQDPDDEDTIYMVFDNGNAMFTYSMDRGTTWSTPVQISTDNMPKIAVDAGTGTLYVASVVGTGIDVYKSEDCGASWTKTGQAITNPSPPATDTMYDPTIDVYQNKLYVVAAPWNSTLDNQYLVATKSTDGMTGASWDPYTKVTEGKIGVRYWWDYWPDILVANGNAYVFYTTEENGCSGTQREAEIAYLTLDSATQTVKVDVPNVLSMTVTPSPYGYGTVNLGQWSSDNPSGQITVANTGDVDLTVTVSASGIWENIDYRVTTWKDANSFQISPLNDGASQNVDTKIYVPDDNQWLGTWTGTVTWEYIAAP